MENNYMNVSKGNISVVSLNDLIKELYDRYEQGSISDIGYVTKCKKLMDDWLKSEKEVTSIRLEMLNNGDDNGY
jgi:hypothetical protein